MKASTLKRFVRLPYFDEHLELHRMDCLSSHRSLTIYGQVKRFLEATPSEEVRPPRLLTGNDLKELGFSPGPVFREILQALEEGQLEGTLKSREDALRFVQQHYQ